ncbi:MAG: NAD(P)/FAD-dependent oxidoreductase, partial [Phycisphaerales bacterium]|nr:NAD(P)/FAD-dependent oxidoreductase [Phycisphaerales bacterium]
MVVGEFAQECDLAVIGGGPGGYSAAFRAADFGLKVTIIDDRPALGGVCLHAGCIPSKTLLQMADTIDRARRSKAMGISFDPPTIDDATVDSWVERTVQRLAKGLDAERTRRKIEIVHGRATFEDNRHLAIQGGDVRRIRFRRAIIAVGAQPLPHDVLAFDGARIRSAREALHVQSLPARIAIIGSGYEALECATIAHALGREVHLIAPDTRWLPGADADLVRPLERRLAKQLTTFRIGIDIKAVAEAKNALTLTLSDDSTIACDAVIVALGSRVDVAELKPPVTLDADGAIVVDEQMTTSNPRIFAVGDCTGGSMLADRAIRQGRVAGEIAAGLHSAFDARCCPHAVFTIPNIAWCGITEDEARAAGLTVQIVKTPWGASGRAAGSDDADGLTKLICDPANELVVGVGITGPNAAELIAEAALAIEMGAT